jgi:polar amino acid transport system substrate-binding protein
VSRFLKYLVLLALLLGNKEEALSAQLIEALSYYPSPPFQLDNSGREGLTADLIAYLNKSLKGKYEIKRVLVPRAKLNKMLARGDKAFVIFAPGMLFGGSQGGSYLWTASLFDDRQELVSRTAKRFEYDGPQSLATVRFAAVEGHVYPMIADALASGEIRPDRLGNEGFLVKALMENRDDVITIPTSVVKYFMMKDLTFGAESYLSKQSLGNFSRHLMFQRGMEKERADFDQVIRQMNVDPIWRATLKQYGLEPPNGLANNVIDAKVPNELIDKSDGAHETLLKRPLALVNIKPLDSPLMLELRKVLDLAFSRAGLSYTLETRPGERALAEFKAGKWDGDPNRVGSFDHVFPQAIRVYPHLYNATSFAVTALSESPITSWSELLNKHIAITRGYKLLENDTQNVKTREVTDSEESCLAMAAIRRVDYCILRGDEPDVWPHQDRYGATLHASRIDQIPIYLWLGPNYSNEAKRLSDVLLAMENKGELHLLMGKFRLKN